MTVFDQVLLVVYAVLWGANTGTFGRLRAFAINELFDQKRFWRCSWWRRAPVRRFWKGLLIGNVAPVAVLLGLLSLPEPSCRPWAILGAGFLGILPAVFPRLMHAGLASNERLERHYTTAEAREVLLRWDRPWAEPLTKHWDSDGWGVANIARKTVAKKDWERNRCGAHVGAATVMFLIPWAGYGLAWLLERAI